MTLVVLKSSLGILKEDIFYARDFNDEDEDWRFEDEMTNVTKLSRSCVGGWRICEGDNWHR